MAHKKAVIIGAGPAGLTAAWELLQTTDIIPHVIEKSGEIGGISRTVRYKDNRIDIGGHRFFSKSQKVMDWWAQVLPIQGKPASDYKVLGRQVSLCDKPDAPDPEETDAVMLVRNRLSRIFYLRRFFNYPVSLNMKTVRNLGIVRILKIGWSYILVQLFPIRPEKSLEDFFHNRFGKELYQTFFKDYTQKVWGLPCSEISSDWGAQRIKGLSLTKTFMHALKQLCKSKDTSISQKDIETSLIEQFLYPKYGPGQLWEEVAGKIRRAGGIIELHTKAVALRSEGNVISGVRIQNMKDNSTREIPADQVISSMPVKDLVNAIHPVPPADVRAVATGLMYRDFITVGLLVSRLRIQNETDIPTVGNIVPDNWIYVQESDVKVGRLQIFNNWSPYMTENTGDVWVGLEYFCDEGDDLWSMPEAEMKQFAIVELEKIGIISAADVKDTVVIQVPKAYPAYFGSYSRFPEIREFTDSFRNLYLVGRNGQHRYNNMDHSMLTAMAAVENIRTGKASKENIWAVNTEEAYHESE